MADDSITMHLTPAERALLLRYGYPLKQVEATLKAYVDSPAVARMSIDSFDLDQLIGNLCYTINRMKLGQLHDQLFELCDRLEAAERYGNGELDMR